jgi:hypothetical protein
MRAPVGARTGTRRAWLALVGCLVLTASSAAAETPFQTWIAYEIREEINCNPGGTTTPLEDPLCLQETTQGFGTRIADATLVGGLFPFPGGVATPAGEHLGGVSISAASILSQVDWTGPAHGKFSLVLDSDITQTGTLSGQLDLAGVRFRNAHFAPIAGRWAGTRGTLKATGRFSGEFLLPTVCPAGTSGPFGCYVGSAGVTPVQEAETVLVPDIGPIALVKLIVILFAK